ncbi:MAG: tetrahydromethanopterin S-methyltransferase subunit C [Methanobacterium sp.]|uniref:tetrahydromethanopterin S-methyltransferase subunit MtrC n=1 Tax=Methanobacterium sp. TaxID=2164 RepID=UPI003D6458DB|nr:tetrahydromethanopterin S-methyltransferase subunit C [Methanobacterium sp.]
MSAAGGGPAGVAVPATQTLALGVVGGLVGIYLLPYAGPVFGPLFAALGAVAAIIWGADAIRRVASYGLGTGVPSIGYMSLSIGVVGGIAGIAGALLLGPKLAIAGPVLGLVISMIVGAIVALVGKKIIKMKIPVLVQGTAELAGASALSVIGFSAAIAGSIELAAIQTAVISTGFIALLFIMNTMAIQHPFNACLGPNEDQTRTLKLAASTGFMSMAIVGLIALLVSGNWKVSIVPIVGALAWLISIRAFIQTSAKDAASVAWSGMWPKEEEH